MAETVGVEEPAPQIEVMGERVGHDPSSAGGPWRLERARGTAAALHAATPELGRRTVRVHEVDRPAVVLGSTQRDDAVDHAAAARLGLQIARRRSGGGAVLLVPHAQVWLDVTVPVDDPLWDHDVGRASWWLGACWRAVVLDLARGIGREGEHGVQVHHGGVDDRELARLACFAATGPGEVLLDGRKVVGISQRRTREGARFQCVAYLDWDPALLLEVLRADAAGLAPALVQRAGALPATSGTTEWSVVERLLAELP